MQVREKYPASPAKAFIENKQAIETINNFITFPFGHWFQEDIVGKRLN
jgi:hypothetical protein